MSRRKIRLIEDNAKCPHLKILLVQELCGRFLSVWGLESHTPLYTLYTCIQNTYSHREGRGVRGRFEPERRKRGNSSQSWVENTNITDCISMINTCRKVLFFRWQHFALVSIKLSSPWHESNLFLFSKERCPFFNVFCFEVCYSLIANLANIFGSLLL